MNQVAGFYSTKNIESVPKDLFYIIQFERMMNWSHETVCVCVCGSVMSDSLQPIDCNPPGYSVHGILQARILEWVAIPFSKGSSQPRDRTWVSHIAGRFFTIWDTREDPKKIAQLATKYISTFGYKVRSLTDRFKWLVFILQKIYSQFPRIFST